MRLGRYAIPYIVRAVVLLNLLAFVLEKLSPGFSSWLVLDRSAFFAGQYWRLLTFLFVPPTQSLFWIAFALLFLWSVGDALEGAMGAFRLNVYYLLGAAGTAVAALFFPLEAATASFLNISLLYAYATFFPHQQILLFFVIPIKVKWVAIFSAVIIGITFVLSPLGAKISLAVSLANYLIFFAPAFVQAFAQRKQVEARRKKFEQQVRPEVESFHKCTVCGRTEKSDPALDFRVAKDGREYCTEHLPKFSAEA